MLLATSGVTVALGLFLTYSLLFVLRVRCVLCLTSHLVNLGLFIMILVYG